MMKELSHASAVISMEALAGGTTAEKAASKLPAFLEKAADFLNKSMISPINDFLAIKDLTWLSIHINRKPYHEMRGGEIVVPDGFMGSLAEYGETLLNAIERFDDLEKDVLQPYFSWISARLEDPDSLRSLTNKLKIPGLQEIKIEDINKKLDKFFPDKKNNLDPNYGDVIRRQADWAELDRQVKKINALYNTPKYDQARQKVSDLTQVLAKLVERLRSGEQDYRVSSVITDQLATITLQVAAVVEYYGLLRVRADEFIRSVNASVLAVREQM